MQTKRSQLTASLLVTSAISVSIALFSAGSASAADAGSTLARPSTVQLKQQTVQLTSSTDHARVLTVQLKAQTVQLGRQARTDTVQLSQRHTVQLTVQL